ncbi:MAG: hypothetical protein GX664_02030 [Bacteroidales bacterium]|jgi:hypothetical protein|nr:hypothetical protein [Bacteroidales bacterium]
MEIDKPLYEDEIISLVLHAIEDVSYTKIFLKCSIKGDTFSYNLEYENVENMRIKAEIWDSHELSCLIKHDQRRRWNNLSMVISVDGTIISDYYFVQYL